MSDERTATQKTNAHAARMKRLRERAQRSKKFADEGYPDAVEWDERGDGTVIMGEIVHIGEPVQTEYGNSVPVQIDNETEGSDGDGNPIVEPVTVWISPFILKEKWKKNRPLEGDYIAIVYLGEQKNRNGSQTYKNFDVHLERAPGNVEKAIRRAKEQRAIAEADGEEMIPDNELPF